MKKKAITLLDVFRSLYFTSLFPAFVLFCYGLIGPVENGYSRLIAMMVCGIIIGLRVFSVVSSRVTIKNEAIRAKEKTAALEKEMDLQTESLREIFELKEKLITKVDEANKMIVSVTRFCKRVMDIKDDPRGKYNDSFVEEELGNAMRRLAKDTGIKVDNLEDPDAP